MDVSTFHHVYCGVCWRDGEALGSLCYCVDCEEYCCISCLQAHLGANQGNREEDKTAKSHQQEPNSTTPADNNLKQQKKALETIQANLKNLEAVKLELLQKVREESVKMLEEIDDLKCEVAELFEVLESNALKGLKNIEDQFEEEIMNQQEILRQAKSVLKSKIIEQIKWNSGPKTNDEAVEGGLSSDELFVFPFESARTTHGNVATQSNVSNKEENMNRHPENYHSTNSNNVTKRFSHRMSSDKILLPFLEDFVYKVHKLIMNSAAVNKSAHFPTDIGIKSSDV